MTPRKIQVITRKDDPKGEKFHPFWSKDIKPSTDKETRTGYIRDDCSLEILPFNNEIKFGDVVAEGNGFQVIVDFELTGRDGVGYSLYDGNGGYQHFPYMMRKLMGLPDLGCSNERGIYIIENSPEFPDDSST